MPRRRTTLGFTDPPVIDATYTVQEGPIIPWSLDADYRAAMATPPPPAYDAAAAARRRAMIDELARVNETAPPPGVTLTLRPDIARKLNDWIQQNTTPAVLVGGAALLFLVATVTTSKPEQEEEAKPPRRKSRKRNRSKRR